MSCNAFARTAIAMWKTWLRLLKAATPAPVTTASTANTKKRHIQKEHINILLLSFQMHLKHSEGETTISTCSMLNAQLIHKSKMRFAWIPSKTLENITRRDYPWLKLGSSGDGGVRRMARNVICSSQCVSLLPDIECINSCFVCMRSKFFLLILSASQDIFSLNIAVSFAVIPYLFLYFLCACAVY